MPKSTNKVYVCYHDDGYECGGPTRVFKHESDAKLWVGKGCFGRIYDVFDLEEYILFEDFGNDE